MSALVASPYRYAVVAGHGRSGTNWVLETLDLSPTTNCRNEPDMTPGTRFADLPQIPHGEIDNGFGRQWDAVLAYSASRLGQTDHPIASGKTFANEWARRSGLLRNIATSPRLRRLLGALEPAFRENPWEFRLPWWLGSQQRLAEALFVVKLVQKPGWIAWLLRRRPQVPVVHIVRHPGGFLDSWRRRWLNKHDPAEVAANNRQRLVAVAERHSDWARRFGDIGAMSVEESELYYWLFATVQIDQAGRQHGSYCRVLFEEMAAFPVEQARRIYRVCGLAWSDKIEARVKEMTSHSPQIADAWRLRLDEKRQALVERFLAVTEIAGWWTGAESRNEKHVDRRRMAIG